MKYIIMKCEVGGMERGYPIIFNERQTHSIVAEYAGYMLQEEWRGCKPEVYSAGFCDVHKSMFMVVRHGSESLGIKEEDKYADRDQDILNMPDALGNMLSMVGVKV